MCETRKKVNIMKMLLVILIMMELFMASSQAQCDIKKCKLPDCRCPSKDIPGDLSLPETPQMIFITWQGHVDADFWNVFRKVFNTTRDTRLENPNGCPVSSTIFVSNEKTKYCIVNRIWAYGHEIANHGLAQKNQEFWRTGTENKLADEFQQQEKNLIEKAHLTDKDFHGWRSPYFQPSGDDLFGVLQEFQVVYDSTLVTGTVGDDSPQIWPYTLDFPLDISIPCNNPPCPEKIYPGLWEVPTIKLESTKQQPCQTLQACDPKDEDETYTLLKRNFDNHYTSNKSPMMVNLNAHWLKEKQKVVDGVIKFMKRALEDHDDVWILSINKGLEWIRNPTKTGQLDRFYPYQCENRKYLDCAGIEDDLENKDSDASSDKDKSDEQKEMQTFLIKNGNNLVIWQYVVLAVSLVVIIRYDRATAKK